MHLSWNLVKDRVTARSINEISPNWSGWGSEALSTVMEDWIVCKWFCNVFMNQLSTKEIFGLYLLEKVMSVNFEAVSRHVQPLVIFHTMYVGFSKKLEIM